MKNLTLFIMTVCLAGLYITAPVVNADHHEKDEVITHTFLATGHETFIFEQNAALMTAENLKDDQGRRDDMKSGKVIWRYPHNTRDGWVLGDGRILLTMTKSKAFPHGGVRLLDPKQDNKVLFEYQGTQDEVNTSQMLDNGNIMLVEAGKNHRILEVNMQGEIVTEIPVEAQTKNMHMQSRMTRKLANGNYIVPFLFDKRVREIAPDGKVVWETPTPNWAFTAIRLDNGNTLINCTYGHITVEVDAAGKTVWQVSNEDLPGNPIKDACGGQRLPNGNTVISSYGIGENGTKLTEVNRDKKVLWQFITPQPHGFHHFQILKTNGKIVEGKPQK